MFKPLYYTGSWLNMISAIKLNNLKVLLYQESKEIRKETERLVIS